MYYLDTNIIIRFLTGDDLNKQAACVRLFEQIENGEVAACIPDIVIAEAVYVLSSPRLYHHPRREVTELLTPLLHLPHLEVQSRHILLRAFQVYADTNDLDFTDAYLVAALEQAKTTKLFSYDHDFDRFPFLIREEPSPDERAA